MGGARSCCCGHCWNCGVLGEIAVLFVTVAEAMTAAARLAAVFLPLHAQSIRITLTTGAKTHEVSTSLTLQFPRILLLYLHSGPNGLCVVLAPSCFAWLDEVLDASLRASDTKKPADHDNGGCYTETAKVLIVQTQGAGPDMAQS